MREIEIKCRVTNPEQLLQKLHGRGIALGEKLTQHDVVYAPHGVAEGDSGVSWLRIRTQNDTHHVLTLKQTLSTNGDSLEHELNISDPVEMTAIIKQMGYELFSDIVKIRRKGHVGDVEICFDEVPPLGSFIEVERLEKHDADPQKVRADLWGLLHELGLTESDEIHAGYDILMRHHLAGSK